MEIKKGDFIVIRIINYPDTIFENRVGEVHKVLDNEKYVVQFLEKIEFRGYKGKTWDIPKISIYKVLKRDINCPDIILK